MISHTRPDTANDLGIRRSDTSGLLLSALCMIVLGWGGLLLLVLNARPRIGAELWVFLLLLQVAVTGSAIPALRWLTLLLAPVTDATPAIVLRRSLWLGILAVICAWLLIVRALSFPLFLLLCLLFGGIEAILRKRERTHGG